MTTPYYQQSGITLYHGPCEAVLPALPAGSVQTCVTSPPYWGLRDYGTATWEGGNAECDHQLPLRRQNLDKLGQRLGTGGGHKASSVAAAVRVSADGVLYISEKE